MVSIRPRRRWFQFSILSLLVFTTVAALLVARYVVPARRQHDAVAEITKLGGQVFYDYGRTGATTPPGPAWLRGFIGNDFFQSVQTVLLLDDKFNTSDELQAALVQVTRLTTVTCLVISSRDGLDDANLQELSKLRTLEVLYLDQVKTTAGGLSPSRSLRI